MGTLFKDTFTDTNGKSLGAHIPDINTNGKPYVLSNFNNGAGTATINSSGQGVVTNGDSYAVVDVGQANVTIQANLMTIGDSGQIVFRRNTSAYFYAEFNAGGVSVYNVIPNTNFIHMGSASYAGISSGALAKVVLTNQTIDVYMNGTKVLTVSSPDNVTATSHGIGSGGGGSAFDNLQIDGAATGGSTVDSGSISVNSDSSLAVSASVLRGTSVSISGDSTLTANSSVLLGGNVQFTADSSLIAVGGLMVSGNITLNSSSDLTLNGQLLLGGTALFDGNSNLIGEASLIINANISVDALSNLTVNGDILTEEVFINLSAISSLTVNASILRGSTVDLSSQSTLTGEASLQVGGKVDLSADSELVVKATVVNILNQIIDQVDLTGKRSLVVQLQGIYIKNTNLQGTRQATINLQGVVE